MSQTSIRNPAVAGTFYPGDRAKLQAEIKRLLLENPALSGLAPKALIAPHAGYVYSGPVAARAYNSITSQADRIRRAVLLGPAHRVPLHGLALPSVEAFRTPLGDVLIDQQAAARIAGLPQVSRTDLPHRFEHSLEVQLPFLQTLLPHFTFVPLVVGWARLNEVAEVLEILWGDSDTLIVISSDLSHYLPYEVARQRDSDTAEHIETLQTPVPDEQACGAYPLNGLLSAARSHRLRVQRLDLRNSGDTAGNRGSVVGYGAWAFHET